MSAAVGTATMAPTTPASAVPRRRATRIVRPMRLTLWRMMRGVRIGVFDVLVDEIEDEDAEHLGPGVECGDNAGEGDGDDGSDDGNDVEQAHEEAEEDEVTDVQKSEDDGAGDSEDDHESALTDEPFADLAVGAAEGGVEAFAFGVWEE